MKHRPIRIANFNDPADDFIVRPEGSVVLLMDGQEIRPSDSVTVDGETSVRAVAVVEGPMEDSLSDRLACEPEGKTWFLEKARAFCTQAERPLN